MIPAYPPEFETSLGPRSMCTTVIF